MNAITIFLFLTVFSVTSAFGQSTANTQSSNGRSPNAQPVLTGVPSLYEIFPKVRAVSLFLGQPFTESFLARTESDIQQSDCRYMTNDQAKVKNMISVLTSSNIQFDAQGKFSEPSEVLYLTLEDGSELKLVFGWPFPHEKNVVGNINGKAAKANLALVDKLYRWAKRTEHIANCNEWIDQVTRFTTNQKP